MMGITIDLPDDLPSFHRSSIETSARRPSSIPTDIPQHHLHYAQVNQYQECPRVDSNVRIKSNAQMERLGCACFVLHAKRLRVHACLGRLAPICGR